MKLALIAVVACLVFLFFYFDMNRYVSIAALKERELWIRGIYAASPTFVITIFMLGTILYVVASLPGAAIPMLIGGALFGRWLGTLTSSVALSIGAVISLLLSRFVFRDFVRRHFARQVAVVDREYEKNGTDYLIAMRLIPVMPYFITNLVFGLTTISPRKFWAISILASLPADFLYTSAGTELSKIQSLSDVLSGGLIATFVALAALPFIGKRITKKFFGMRHLKERSKD